MNRGDFFYTELGINSIVLPYCTDPHFLDLCVVFVSSFLATIDISGEIKNVARQSWQQRLRGFQ